MKKTIALLAQEVEYTLQTSERARSLRLTIHYDGRVVVTAPPLVNQAVIERFIRGKSAWVIDKLNRFRRSPRTVIEAGRNGFIRHKDRALALVLARLTHFNELYGFRFNQVTIKNQKARWGSCSKKGNLNFNYKIALLPRELADYIIVHELCHLAEFNHSASFWAQMEHIIPNWRIVRKGLARIIVR